jgi:hypothetical protein
MPKAFMKEKHMGVFDWFRKHCAKQRGEDLVTRPKLEACIEGREDLKP